MKLNTEQLLGTLELLSEPLQVYDEEIGGSYTTFYWDASIKGKFNLWNLMIDEKYIQPISPEIVISQWILDEWLHPIVPVDKYLLTHKEHFLDINSRVKRYKIFQKIYSLLSLNLEKLEAFNFIYRLGTLVGKISNDNWLVISPNAPHIQDFPYWITCSNFKIEKYHSQQTIQLQSAVKELLETLTPLQLSIKYEREEFSFDFYYSYAFAKTKIEAFIQALSKTKIVQAKRFISLSSDYRQHFYNGDKRRKTIYVLNQFLQQKLSNINVYYFTKYDNDFTYIIGETSDNNCLGVKISRSYRYY
ncbi:MAG: nuclease A inhibitor family protein [Rivularia sp. (in: cyanobacteria)]